jgi:PAS domain S-box-containing protein
MPQFPVLPMRSWLKVLGFCIVSAGLSVLLFAYLQGREGDSPQAAARQQRLEKLEALMGLQSVLSDMSLDLNGAAQPPEHWVRLWLSAQRLMPALHRELALHGPGAEDQLQFSKALAQWRQAQGPAVLRLSQQPVMSDAERQTLRGIQQQWAAPLLVQTRLLYQALSQEPVEAVAEWTLSHTAMVGLSLLLLTTAWVALWGIRRSLRLQVGAESVQLVDITREIVNSNLAPALGVPPGDQTSVQANIAVMLQNLQANQSLNQRRSWLDKGLALINDTVRNEHSITDLARKISENLTVYLDLQACALYLYGQGAATEAKKPPKALKLYGQYGAGEVDEFPATLVHGLTALQRVALTGELLAMADLPQPLLEELSTQPLDEQAHYVLVPLTFESRVRGAVVLKSREPLPEDIGSLMMPGSVAIGVAVESALNRETMVASLLDAQRLTNQLQSNHEELQQSQMALSEKIHYVNDILSSMHSGLVIVDREGKIEDCNPALLEMAGLERDQLVGQHSNVLFEEDETSLMSILKGYGQLLTRLGMQDAPAYRALISGSMLGCMLVDGDGRIIEANSRVGRITGYSPEELQTMQVVDLVPVRHRSRHAELMALSLQDENLHRPGSGRMFTLVLRDRQELRVEVSLVNHQFEGNTVTLTLIRTDQDLPWAVINSSMLQQLMTLDEDSMVTRLRHADGHHTPVRLTSSFLLDSSGLPQQTVINVHDVSSLVNKGKEIRAQHQLLEMTMDAMQDGVLRVDRDGVLVGANPMALSLLGMDKSVALKSRIGDLFPGEQNGRGITHWLPFQYSQLMVRLIQDILASSDGAYNLPVPLLCLRHDGGLEWATSSACALLGIYPPPQNSEVSVMLAEQTTEYLQHLRHTLSHSMDAPQIVDVPWRAGSAPVMRLPTLIVPSGAVSDDQMVVWLIPELDALCAHAIQRALNIEWLILHPEGLLIPVLLTASPLLDPYGRLTGAVLTIKDMRELKEKESENLRMVQKMEQSQRLDALGQLAAGVAHDFNNLLGVIQSHAELVEMKVGPDSKATRNLSAILQATTRARDIVIKLNGLGREERREDEQEEVQSLFELVPLLRETQSLLQASLKGIDILVVPDENMPAEVCLRGQSGSLQQVIVNLCVNGSHAIGERRNGQLLIEPHAPVNGFVCVDVVDNGSGIPPEVLPRIFEPFFTTKEVGKGTGLGLAMVRSIVTRMNGTIECHSEVGIGTRFSLRLPCVTR